jgi:hypothetical protein
MKLYHSCSQIGLRMNFHRNVQLLSFFIGLTGPTQEQDVEPEYLH